MITNLALYFKIVFLKIPFHIYLFIFYSQVLSRYGEFKKEARNKREKLEDSRRFQYFKRDSDELESWIHEKLQAASDESYKDPTNLQVYTRRESLNVMLKFLL